LSGLPFEAGERLLRKRHRRLRSSKIAPGYVPVWQKKPKPALFLSFCTGIQVPSNLVFMTSTLADPAGLALFPSAASAEVTDHRRKNAQGKKGPVNRRRHDFDYRHLGCIEFCTLENGS
jgi:hypothetical protein